MASNKCDSVNRCKNSWWCAVDYNPKNKDCFEAMSNGDRIRAMTDEELAELIAPSCPPGANPAWKCVEEEKCQSCWLDWLKGEVEE